METIPTIIQAAAWIYVLKHLIPLVALPVLYVCMRLIYGNKEEANQAFAQAFLEGVQEALNDK